VDARGVAFLDIDEDVRGRRYLVLMIGPLLIFEFTGDLGYHGAEDGRWRTRKGSVRAK
jgi:hypothetical protein